MSRPWLSLLLGAASVAALVAFIAWRASSGAPPPTAPSTASSSRAAAARRALQAMAAESERWMPDELRGLYLGMPLVELRGARPRLRLARAQGPEASLWEETLPSGARVVAQVAPRHDVLVKVQALSRLDDVSALRGHFEALRARYGDPTGFWDCPERPDASAVRRITWRGEHATLMEAILVYGGRASVTLVVSGTEDVARALAASACTPVTAATLADWPVARVLRGERVDTMDMR